MRSKNLIRYVQEVYRTINFPGSRISLVLLFVCLPLFFYEKADGLTLGEDSGFPLVAPSAQQFAGIDNIVRDEMIKQEIVGMAVGVIQNGRVVHMKAYGHSNKKRNIAMTTKTPLRWASISKTLTAVAAMKLVEEGKLKLDDKVTDHLSSSVWPQTGNKKDITIRHLLNNTSGINHYGNGNGGRTYTNNSYSGSTTSFDASAAVAIFKDANLDANPGDAYLYSTYGFSLLAAVIDKVAPNGYIRYIEDNVKKPLGMNTLAPSYNKFEAYTNTCMGQIEYLEGGKAQVLPGGGWLSSVEDLVKFMDGLMKKQLLEDTSKSLMWANNGNGYGLGMQLRTRCGVRVIGHGGTHDNMRTNMYFFQDRKDGIVIMVNSYSVDLDRIFERIAQAIGRSCVIPDRLVTDECRIKNNSCENKVAATWRRSSGDVLIRRAYTASDFSKVVSDLQSAGFHCMDIETYTVGSTRYWDGLFSGEYTRSVFVSNLDQDAFNKRWNELSGSGYRLIDVETYGSGSGRRWAGMFVNGSGKHALFRNFSTDDFGKKRTELAAQGYKLIDIEAYVEGSSLLWAGVWSSGTDGLLIRNYTDADFSAKHFEFEKQGNRIIDVETYVVSGKRYWAGVWEKASETQKINRNLSYCDILEKNSVWEKDGLEIQDIEVY